MKKTTSKAKSRKASKSKSKATSTSASKVKSTKAASGTTPSKSKSKSKSKPKPKPKAKAKARARAAKPAPKRRASRARKARPARSWLGFVAQHGVVLASARGPLPNVAEEVAGEPIIGSWWAHPKGKTIFAALAEIDDSPDVRCFKLVDGKVTYAHRSAWPALVRLGRDGVIASEQLGSLQQEHMPTGEHRNFITPFPDWVDEDTARAADAMTTETARARLAWLDAPAG